MTEREFSAWLSFHSARFPNWASWLSKMPPDQSKEVTKAMFEVLQDRSLEDCKTASKRLASGDEPEIDQFDQHPRAVRAVAKRLAGDKIKTTNERLTHSTKERTYRCTRCWDASVPLVTVFHQQTIDDARDVQRAQEIVARKRGIYTTAVACDCERGTEHARVAKVKQFNDRMLLVENKLFLQQRLEELIEWANRENRNAWSAGD
jgi:hypothetical protein